MRYYEVYLTRENRAYATIPVEVEDNEYSDKAEEIVRKKVESGEITPDWEHDPVEIRYTGCATRRPSNDDA